MATNIKLGEWNDGYVKVNGVWVQSNAFYKSPAAQWKSLWPAPAFVPDEFVYFDGTVHGLIDGTSDLEGQRLWELNDIFWNFNSWFRMDEATGTPTLFRINDTMTYPILGNYWLTFRIYKSGINWKINWELPSDFGNTFQASGTREFWNIDEIIPGMDAGVGEWFNLGITVGGVLDGPLESGEFYSAGTYPKVLKIWYNGVNVIDYRIPTGPFPYLGAWSPAAPSQTGRWCFFCDTEKTGSYEGAMARSYLWSNTLDADYREIEMDDTDAVTLYNNGLGLSRTEVANAGKSGTSLSLAHRCIWAPDYSTAPASGATGSVTNDVAWLAANSTMYGTEILFDNTLLVSDPNTSGVHYEDLISAPGSGVYLDWPL